MSKASKDAEPSKPAESKNLIGFKIHKGPWLTLDTSLKKPEEPSNANTYSSPNEEEAANAQFKKDKTKWTENNEVRSTLDSYLLSSLQMSNLIVLAGSGTSLDPMNGPSMWDLWIKCQPFITDDIKDILQRRLNYDVTKEDNIENFLSIIELLVDSYHKEESAAEIATKTPGAAESSLAIKPETRDEKNSSPKETTKERLYKENEALKQCLSKMKNTILDCCRLFLNPAEGLYEECSSYLNTYAENDLLTKCDEDNPINNFVENYSSLKRSSKDNSDKQIALDRIREKIINRSILIWGMNLELWNKCKPQITNGNADTISIFVKALDGKEYKKQGDSKQYPVELLLNKAETYLKRSKERKSEDYESVEKWKNNLLELIFNSSPELLNKTCSLNAHSVFLQKLSRRRTNAPRPKLFTTNYDRCFETAAGQKGQVLIDGFSFTNPRIYDPSFFGYDIVRKTSESEHNSVLQEGVIKLYKIHGSVDWKRVKNAITIDEHVSGDDACMIFPAKQKYHQSYIQPHLEMMSQYLEALREPETCVLVIGFGLHDDHLSEPLLSAIKSNSSLRVIFVVPHLEDKETSTDKDDKYWSEAFKEMSNGADIAMISTKFEPFAKEIPDIRTLSTDDRAIKALRELIREASIHD